MYVKYKICSSTCNVCVLYVNYLSLYVYVMGFTPAKIEQQNEVIYTYTGMCLVHVILPMYNSTLSIRLKLW